MRFDSAMAAISYLGIVVQFGGTLVLVVLFTLLHRFVFRRSYFSAWAGAWLAILVALATLVVRYTVLPGIGRASPTTAGGTWGWLTLGYQIAKLGAFALFLQGTRSYVRGADGRIGRRLLVGVPVAYAIISTLAAGGRLRLLVVWQTPVAVAVLGSCAWMLLRLPPSRRTPGSITTGSTFAFLAVLWGIYARAFGIPSAEVPGHAVLATVVNFNSYFDLLLNFLLGFGMVVLLMEDAKREVDDAQAELRVAHDHLRRAALYDSLTESLNRRAFAEGVGLEMARATFGTVVIADVDDLKGVNDAHGHAAGDRLLRHCADVLRSALRPSDRLYRWGGDEFLIVIPSARAADVERRLSEVLESSAAVTLGGSAGVGTLHVSVGLADYESAEELAAAIDRADRAMYVHKRGRKAARDAAERVTGERREAARS